MKEEYLQKLEENFQAIKDKQALRHQNKERLKELKENPLVQEYIKLAKEVSEYPREKTESEIINDLYLKFHIKDKKDTNGIYYCLGTFKYIVYDGEIRLRNDDPEAQYRVYANIESYSDLVKVPIKKCDEFEQTNPVIISSYEQEGMSEYAEIQKEFFITAIKEGQEKACEKVLIKTKKLPK